LTPTALAASPVAGLSCPWPIASTPLLSRLCAACFSLVGSNQVFVQTTCTVAPGWVVWAPSATALISFRACGAQGHAGQVVGVFGRAEILSQVGGGLEPGGLLELDVGMLRCLIGHGILEPE